MKMQVVAEAMVKSEDLRGNPPVLNAIVRECLARPIRPVRVPQSSGGILKIGL